LDSVAIMTDYSKDPQLVPYLLYEDAGAAMDWLIRTFGFTERVRDRQDDGTVRHGELLLDHGGVIMLGSPGGDFRGPASLGQVTQLQCITITDLTAHREHARAAGADVSEISLRANQVHSYTVDDPEGHRWYFSEPL
jgi:PhnB protein